MIRSTIRAAAAILCALSLPACIDSSGPILSGAKPLFGDQLNLQFYSLRKGFIGDPEQATYAWDGTKYRRVGGGMADIDAFALHPFGRGNFVVQSEAAKRPGIFEYAVVVKLTDGVYRVVAIDENDAETAIRTRYCKRVGDSYCRVETRESLYAFARASAQRRKDQGSLILRLADGARPR